MSQLHLQPLSTALVEQITSEAYGLLAEPGVYVHHREALTLLADAGAQVNFGTQLACIPEKVIQETLSTIPYGFSLYNLDGHPAVHYGGEQVQFAPGMGAVTLLADETGAQRQPQTTDFVRFIKLVEALTQYDAHSTAFVCRDVPDEIGDIYRLYLAMNFASKPILTSAFTKNGWRLMWEMLVAVLGGAAELAARPWMVFEVSPSPPLRWSEMACQHLMDCARKGLPVQLASRPISGVTAPITLASAAVQHTAENLSGLVLTQLAHPGAPVVWGGAPALADMRTGVLAMGDVSTWLLNSAFAQVGRSLGLPTHASLGSSDAKTLDFQAGMEACGSIFLAALSQVNLVTGAGMIDFLRCQSFEKLVMDADLIGMARRLNTGIEAREDPIALDKMRQAPHRAEYYTDAHTRKWFKHELFVPSEVVDRLSLDAWRQRGGNSIYQRATDQVHRRLKAYRSNSLSDDVRAELRKMIAHAAAKSGLSHLPALE